jgi:hypothetical protein
MTSIAVRHTPAADVSVDLGWLVRLVRRVAAFRRHRRYPSVRLAARWANQRWAADVLRHRF